MYTMFRTQREEKPYAVQVNLDSALTEMEVDAGAFLSVISEGTLATVRIGPCFPLRKSTKKLKAYTAEEIPVLVACTFSVFYKNAETRKLDIVVVKGKALLCWEETGWKRFSLTGQRSSNPKQTPL